MNLLMHSQAMPFLLGLSTGLLVPLLGWVLVELLKTWRSRQVLPLPYRAVRPNQRVGLRGV